MAKRDFPTIDNHQHNAPIETPPVNKVETEVVKPDDEVKTDVIKTVKPVFGTVTDCSRLNIRLEPKVNASVLCVVNAGERLLIDNDKSTDDWYSVTNKVGAEGFCMKKYVSVQ